MKFFCTCPSSLNRGGSSSADLCPVLLQVKDYSKKDELTSSSHSSTCQLLLQGTIFAGLGSIYLHNMSCQSRTTSDSKNNGERRTHCTILKPNTKERMWYHRQHLLHGDHSLEGFVQILSAERSNYVPSDWCSQAHLQWDVTAETGIYLYVQQYEERHSLQQWPGTLTALSTGPAVHLPEHHTLNLFHQSRCSSGGVQCLLAESQDFSPSVTLLHLCCPENILSGTAGTNNWHQEAGECQWHSGQGAAWEYQSPRLCSWLWELHQLKQSRSVFTSQIFSLHPVFHSRKHWICTELA